MSLNDIGFSENHGHTAVEFVFITRTLEIRNIFKYYFTYTLQFERL